MLDLRINNELSAEEYNQSKLQTTAQIEQLNDEKLELSKNKLEWIDRLEEKYNLLDGLAEKFELGSIKEKRNLLIALGERFVVNKGFLEISLKSWLQPITKANDAIKSEYKEFEPIIKGSVEPSISQNETLLSIRRGRPDSNRRSSA